MRIDWISFDAILFWPERSRSAAFVPFLPTTLQKKKKERKTARPCWFFPFTQLSFHALLISAAHAVVPFNGHRQKVFNLMPATWSGNLSYEHSLHSQKTLLLSLPFSCSLLNRFGATKKLNRRRSNRKAKNANIHARHNASNQQKTAA